MPKIGKEHLRFVRRESIFVQRGIAIFGSRSRRPLFDNIAPNFFLPGVLFRRIRVAAIHHQHRRQTCLRQFRFRFANALRIIIRTQPSSPQNNVTRRIAGRAYDARDAFLINSQKTVRRSRG